MTITKLITISSSVLFFTSASFSQEQAATRDYNLEGNSPILARLIAQADQDASKAYEPLQNLDSEVLENLSYSQYKGIRFNAENSIWRGQNPYEIQLFHSGFLYQTPIKINVIDYANNENPFDFNPSLFIYDGEAKDLAASVANTGSFAGFRVHYPINQSEYKDEFAVFLGASYFRLIGKNQHYGISSRAVALNTGLAEGEEFPYFTEFWLIEPTMSNKLSVYAKLESPSMTGVFKFVINTNEDTHARVDAWIFAREDIEKVGLAPFTSMFLYGEGSQTRPDDFRPEVHDSDGIYLVTHKGEKIWRPLANPNRLRITSLSDASPKAFAMLQRDIQYSHYLDSEAHYHKRPGLLVEPIEGFNSGRLELLEIPTNSETHDNIVSYWVNDKPVVKGDMLKVSYNMRTLSSNANLQEQPWVLRTLQGSSRLPGEPEDDDILTRRFVIDFANPSSLNVDFSALSAQVSASNASVDQVRVFDSNFGKEIRATFLVTPNDEDEVVDMRLNLIQNGKVIGETWSFIYE